MSPEIIFLSPLHYPVQWAAFLVKWGSTLLCVLFAFRLWRITSDRWWMLISIAFLLSIVWYVAVSALIGAPPLPIGFVESEGLVEKAAFPEPSATFTQTIRTEHEWDIVAPIIAVALWTACRALKSREKLAGQR
jgi:hypothetical protein